MGEGEEPEGARRTRRDLVAEPRGGGPRELRGLGSQNGCATQEEKLGQGSKIKGLERVRVGDGGGW